MLITKDYLFKHQTINRAWTKAQIQALGVEYPPSKGWINRLTGTDIDKDAAKLFESGATKYSTKSNLTAIKKRLVGLTDLELIELKIHLNNIGVR